MSLGTGLIHLWEFETDVGMIPDLIGSDDLMITGTQIPAVTGKIDKAGDFRTTQNYATLQGSAADLDAVDAFSVMTWIWTPANPSGNRRAWIVQSGTVALIRASIGSTNRAFVQQFNASETPTPVAPANKAFTQEAWVHYGYTFERGVRCSLYVNGELVDQVALAFDEPSPTGASIALNIQARDGIGGGAGTGSEPLDGMQDQFAIWDRALTANEVRQLVRGGFGQSVEALAMVAMAQQAHIVMGTQGDSYTDGLVVHHLRFVPDAATSLAGDRVVLTDPVTTEILWEHTVEGPNIPRDYEVARETWPNGATLSTLTSDRGTLYIGY